MIFLTIVLQMEVLSLSQMYEQHYHNHILKWNNVRSRRIKHGSKVELYGHKKFHLNSRILIFQEIMQVLVVLYFMMGENNFFLKKMLPLDTIMQYSLVQIRLVNFHEPSVFLQNNSIRSLKSTNHTLYYLVTQMMMVILQFLIKKELTLPLIMKPLWQSMKTITNQKLLIFLIVQINNK